MGPAYFMGKKEEEIMQNNMYTGRLTRDPEIRYSTGEKPVAIARGNLAVDHHPRGKKEKITTFINFSAIGNLAEVFEKYTKKGSEIYVSGYWRNNDYTNKDGNKVYQMDFIVESMEFGRRPSDQSEQGVQRKGESDIPAPGTAMDGFMNIPDGIDEELPFN